MSNLESYKRFGTTRGAMTICGTLAMLAMAPSSVYAGLETRQPTPLNQAQIVGTEAHPMLVIPMDVPGWAVDLGVTGAERVYKGICGPNGAHISVNDLFRAAQRDLQLLDGNQRGTSTQVFGESPAFAVSYDTTDPVFQVLYLPVVQSAADYIDGQFDNRVEIGATMALGTFDNDVIGSAGSTRFTIPWSVYVEGLRRQSLREDARFASQLPFSSIPVTYNASTSATAETQIRVTAAQLRAIFGDNVAPQGQAVSITFNSNTSWNFLGCNVEPASGQQSLIDVAVHEFTHAMGFTSQIAEGGGNSAEQIQGLDVARFRANNLPGSSAQFANNPRIGESFTGEFHFYSSFPTGTSTLLESGDGDQPSHLNYISDPADKLGVMDPVISRGTTRCPNFYSQNDIQPLDDMGWRPVAAFGFNDCNGNGNPDIVDIALGISQDVDHDSIPDECESFSLGAGDPLTNSGVTRTIFETPGLTDLSVFDPANPAYTPVASVVVADMNDPMSFPNSNTRVIQYEFSMFVPARDEYAFRVAHPDDMFLIIDNIVIGESERSGRIQHSGDSTELSSQSFMQLEAGWHDVFVQVLSNEATPFVRMVRESRSLGGWQDIPTNNLKAINFADCDGNGQNDPIDLLDDLANTIDLGLVGEDGVPIQFDTFGSNFDTEMALWDAAGTLIAQNDDSSPSGRQSIITQSLAAGQYILAVNGYNSVYSNGPGLDFVGGCSDSGSYMLNIDSVQAISGSIPPSRVHTFVFTVGSSADCDGDGTPDSQELDCDGNGVPDECEIPTLAEAEFVGIVGDSSQAITYSTCGSSFDTEIALWDESGNLIEANDDFCGLQSEITRKLEPGIYYAGIAGYNAFFSENFGIEININGCTEGGELVIQLGSLDNSNDPYSWPAGRVGLLSFEITEPAGCNAADLNMDGQLNFFDVSVFLTAYSANDLAADFNNDGQLNFFDVSIFLSLFGQGCP